MSQDVVINGTTYPAVESVQLNTADGKRVLYFEGTPVDIAQETGDGETTVMSQKAVTGALATVGNPKRLDMLETMMENILYPGLTENLLDGVTFHSGMLNDDLIPAANSNFRYSEPIPVSPGEQYFFETFCDYTPSSGNMSFKIIASRDQGLNSDGNYTVPYTMVTKHFRTTRATYRYAFTVPADRHYLRIGLRITDKNNALYKMKNSETKRESLFWESNAYTQGMCVGGDYVFISDAPEKSNGTNSYYVKKLDKATGEVVATSTGTFNHANGMTYKEGTNHLLICGLDGNSGTEQTTSEMDYCLYVVDADTLETVDIVNLKTQILSVCPQSGGISGVAYNNFTNELYTLTRHPERHIVVLNDNYSVIRDIYMWPYADDHGIRGDICTDGMLIYSPEWRDDLANTQLQNDIAVFTRHGRFLGMFSNRGITHIESMDIDGEDYYLNYIDFDDGSVAKTVKANGLFDVNLKKSEQHTAVDYIESSGTQYINTGLTGGINAEYEIVFDPVGAAVSASEAYFQGPANSTSEIPRIAADNSTQVNIGSIVGKQNFLAREGSGIITAKFADNIFTINGTEKLYNGTTPFGVGDMSWGGSSWFIFNRNSGSPAPSRMRLYSFKAWTNGELVRDLIPVVRDVDGVACLYDKVTNQYFENAGTGAFIVPTEVTT